MIRTERRFVVWALLLAQASIAAAQAPNPGKYSPAQYTVQQSRGHKVAMRDGVNLSVDIYQPATPGRYASILAISPYDNNTAGMRQRAHWFAERGYSVVLADSRGRYDSEGEWDPFGAKHKSDGYDLVEWVAKQPWSTGRVGMIGGSYLGWTQWWTASTAPPSLKAIAPEVAPPDQFRNAPYQNGVLVSWILDWQAGLAGHTAQAVAPGPYGGFTNTRADDMLRTPYIQLNHNRGVNDAPWFDTWIRDNLSTSNYWKGISYQGKENYSKVTVPSLAVSGWFDANHPGTPMNYIGMKQYGATPEARRPSLIIGPWPHGTNIRNVGTIDYGPDAVIDLNGYIARWFDHYLKGLDNGVETDPPVYVFVMGPNKWYAEKDWPLPQTQWTKYYLRGQGKANSFKGDGVLGTTPPSGQEPADTYVYDPAKPTRDPYTPFPNTNGHINGALDTRLSAISDDVLVYTTPVLTEDVEVTGPVTATLYASTSARDTDWMMRLIDVRPDGSTALLNDGVIRARSRNPDDHGRFTAEKLSTIEPNRVYEYGLEFWRGTGNVFQKGHRIRVEISSSFYPYYLPNLNTGEDNVGLATRPVVATQKVYHTSLYPSHIVLPVIPRR
jgi:uncharacterized protein